MSYTGKVVSISLGSLLLVAVAGFLADSPGDHYAGMTFAIFLAFFMVIEVVVLLIVWPYTSCSADHQGDMPKRIPICSIPMSCRTRSGAVAHKRKSRAYFLSAVLVLLIGTSVCFGGASIF